MFNQTSMGKTGCLEFQDNIFHRGVGWMDPDIHRALSVGCDLRPGGVSVFGLGNWMNFRATKSRE